MTEVLPSALDEVFEDTIAETPIQIPVEVLAVAPPLIKPAPRPPRAPIETLPPLQVRVKDPTQLHLLARVFQDRYDRGHRHIAFLGDETPAEMQRTILGLSCFFADVLHARAVVITQRWAGSQYQLLAPNLTERNLCLRNGELPVRSASGLDIVEYGPLRSLFQTHGTTGFKSALASAVHNPVVFWELANIESIRHDSRRYFELMGLLDGVCFVIQPGRTTAKLVRKYQDCFQQSSPEVYGVVFAGGASR